jgi:hypothetical protein
MTYVIAEPCIDVKDKACVDECPGQLHLRERTDALHPVPLESSVGWLTCAVAGRLDMVMVG